MATPDNEIEPQYKEAMRNIGKAIDLAFNPIGGKVNGFFLAVFPFNDEGRFNYISNAERDGIIVLLKEMIKRFEGYPEPPRGRA
jgi:hypothetical protein